MEVELTLWMGHRRREETIFTTESKQEKVSSMKCGYITKVNTNLRTF